MKGKRFVPIPDPDGALTPPPRKPPIAIATAAPVPPRRGRDLVERVPLQRGRRRRRLRKRAALLRTALDAVARSVVSAVRRQAGT